MHFTEAVTLESEFARLEQLSLSHTTDLAEAVSVGDLSRTWYTDIPAPEAMGEVIAQRLARQAAGNVAPWAIIDQATGKAVGMTTNLNLDPTNRRVEIGSTWLGKEAQGTRINPAAKLLLLTRAFEDLKCVAVEFRTHWHNHQSRGAIERLGAKQDGVLRNHKILENGTVRDTVVYSIIDSEWNTVKFALQERLKN